MPLDYERGEMVGGFGPHYHVVPTAKWTDSPFWAEAHANAMKVFKKTVNQQRMAQRRPLFLMAGFSPESVLTQEYRADAAIVFIFWAKIGDKEFHYVEPILLPPEAENQLILTGRWKRERVQ